MLDADQLDHFAAVFAALGTLHLAPPAPETLDGVRGLFVDEWPLPPTEHYLRARASMGRSAELGETAEQIGRDHDTLYGVSAAARVSPYESVHRGTEGLVFDIQTLQVRDSYRSLGLRAPHPNREPDDHIGLELDFVAQSCLRALDAGDPDRAEELVGTGRDFLRDHLDRWAPDVLARVESHAATEFMRGLAAATVGALDSFRTAVSA